MAVSKKPTEVRMGKGKGEVDKWVFKAGAGRVLLEVGGVSKAVAKAALAAAGFKLNVKTSFVDKADELTC